MRVNGWQRKEKEKKWKGQAALSLIPLYLYEPLSLPE